jgi:hypothetical protein
MSIKFALVNAAQVLIFNTVIKPEMAATGFFAGKKGYDFAAWEKVEAVVAEPGQVPGGYKDGERVNLPQTNFFDLIETKYPAGVVRDTFFSNLFLELAKAGHPMEQKMIRDAFHVFSKAIRFLVTINEDGSYTLHKGTPGHIPGLKAKSMESKLKEAAELNAKLEAEHAATMAELQALKLVHGVA